MSTPLPSLIHLRPAPTGMHRHSTLHEPVLDPAFADATPIGLDWHVIISPGTDELAFHVDFVNVPTVDMMTKIMVHLMVSMYDAKTVDGAPLAQAGARLARRADGSDSEWEEHTVPVAVAGQQSIPKRSVRELEEWLDLEHRSVVHPVTKHASIIFTVPDPDVDPLVFMYRSLQYAAENQERLHTKVAPSVVLLFKEAAIDAVKTVLQSRDGDTVRSMPPDPQWYGEGDNVVLTEQPWRVRLVSPHAPAPPNLSRLALGDKEPVETGAPNGATKSGINKPRARVLLRRRISSIAHDVHNNEGKAGELFQTIKSYVCNMWPTMGTWYWCEKRRTNMTPDQKSERVRIANNHATVAKRIIEKYALNDAYWTKQDYFSLRGEIHDTIVPESTFREFINAYFSYRVDMGALSGTDALSDFSKTPTGQFAQVDWEMNNQLGIAKKLAAHAQLLSPLIDAIRKFGFVPEGHEKFEVKWRILPMRHNNASVWHMDSNDFMLYGDDSMENAARWTKSGNRAVVTVSCLNLDPNKKSVQCGTRVLSGLPMLTEQAVKGVVDDMWEAKDLLHSYMCPEDKEFYAIMFNRLIREQTGKAIAHFISAGDAHDYRHTAEERMQRQEREEKLLENAGVQVVRMNNGEIGTFNDHAFHASSAVPPNHVRIFFVLKAVYNTDRKGQVVGFREDAEILDSNERRAKLTFIPI